MDDEGAPSCMIVGDDLPPAKYARKSEVSMKTIAAPAVNLPRKLVGPLEPKRVCEEPPPNTAPMSVPFPV
jgi:hypothetical protein